MPHAEMMEARRRWWFHAITTRMLFALVVVVALLHVSSVISQLVSVAFEGSRERERATVRAAISDSIKTAQANRSFEADARAQANVKMAEARAAEIEKIGLAIEKFPRYLEYLQYLRSTQPTPRIR